MSAYTHRRLQTRPLPGVRTVELSRGVSGFGFTVSGQQPAILSNILAGSPAHRVGLRSGDHVLAVNRRNVAQLNHEEVVQAIGRTTGCLQLQIAENYGSSSEDEEAEGRRKPVAGNRHAPSVWAHPTPLAGSRNVSLTPAGGGGFHSDDEEYAAGGRVRRPRPYHARGNSADSTLTEASIHPPSNSTVNPSPSKSKQVDLMGTEELHLTESQISSFLHPTLSELRQSIKQRNTLSNPIAVNEAVLKAVVGYLGTIEMPKEKNPSSTANLLAIRNCIKRLRVEKKVHTMVLMCIFPAHIALINHHGLKLADYPSHQITFCGQCTDDKRFFGLVTSRLIPTEPDGPGQAAGEEFSSSCHVFMTEPITDRMEMERRAQAFQFQLTFETQDPSVCREFPANADGLISCVMATYGKSDEAGNGRPPPPASVASGGLSPATNSSTTSNSDSGIGFRDDNQPGNSAERILMLDLQHQRFQMQNLSRLNEEEEIALPNGLPHLESDQSPKKLDVQAMPLPRTAASSGDDSFNTERLDVVSSADNIRQSMHKYLQSKHQHLKSVSEQLSTSTSSQTRGRTPTQAASTIFAENLNSMIDFRSQANGGRLMRTPSNRSVARSLEDLRDDDFRSAPLNQAEVALLKSNPNLPAPLVRYLYNSESNLSQLSAVEVLSTLSTKSIDNKNMAHGGSQPPALRGSNILKPGDQYPSEPGVLRGHYNRPVSSQSRRSERSASMASQDEGSGPNWAEGESFDTDKHEKLGWSRSSSVRRHLSRRSLSSSKIDQLGQTVKGENKENDVVITDELDETLSQRSGSVASERGIDIGRVGMWATDFEKLLHDPVGLQTFTEFLKKEFSAENIYFWVACQHYRNLEKDSERHISAIQIMDKHLSAGAPEPVNVDSHARQAAQDGMATTTPTMFNLAQKQIYNLMKFDSFSRFLKSDLYKESLLAEMSGKILPFSASLEAGLSLKGPEDEEVVKAKDKSSLSWGKKTSKGDVENRRRSLLPWGNLRGGKDRSKSKERSGESDLKAAKSMTLVPTQAPPLQHKFKSKSKDDSYTTSRASLTSGDVSKLSGNPRDSSSLSHNNDCEGCTLARVILPDKATTVVQTRNHETIRAMVSRLMDKRGLKYTSFDVFAPNQDKPLDLSEDCSTLGCTEVRVEPRVLFRLELPSKKSIGVKAKPAKIIRDVLGPILDQYGWRLEHMKVRRDNSRFEVNLEDTVLAIDNSRLVVINKTPDDISSQLLEDIIQVKRPHLVNEDQRSIRTDSSTESGTRIYKRLSFESEKMSMPPPERIPVKRGGPGSAFSKPFPSENPTSAASSLKNHGVAEELYEGLKLAQRGRLDDQRGTEINFEMPDFLKRGDSKCRHNTDKENSFPYQSPLPHRQSEPLGGHPRRDVFPHDPRLSSISSNYYSQIDNDYPPLGGQGFLPRDSFFMHNRSHDSNFSHEGYIPNPAEAERFFNASNHSGEFSSGQFNESRISLGFGNTPQRRGHHHSLPPQSLEPQQNVYETLSHYQSGNWNLPPSSLPPADPALRRDPPPLPPKPRFGRMGRPSGVSSEVDLPANSSQPGRGYAVSFV